MPIAQLARLGDSRPGVPPSRHDAASSRPNDGPLLSAIASVVGLIVAVICTSR